MDINLIMIEENKFHFPDKNQQHGISELLSNGSSEGSHNE